MDAKEQSWQWLKAQCRGCNKNSQQNTSKSALSGAGNHFRHGKFHACDCKKCFPNAELVIDRFYVQKLSYDAQNIVGRLFMRKQTRWKTLNSMRSDANLRNIKKRRNKEGNPV